MKSKLHIQIVTQDFHYSLYLGNSRDTIHVYVLLKIMTYPRMGTNKRLFNFIDVKRK